jgi:flagellar hook-basal body complex protein FliE
MSIPSISGVGSVGNAHSSSGISSQVGSIGARSEVAKSSNEGGAFSDLVSQFVSQTNQDQRDSGSSLESLIKGETNNLQGVVMSMAKAEMSFQFFMEVRNKLIDSYRDLMRMQV